MSAVLCTPAVAVLLALAGCRPEYEQCTQGPGWRLECTEKTEPAEVQRGPARAPSASPAHRHRTAPSDDIGGPVRAEVSAIEHAAPSAPSAG